MITAASALHWPSAARSAKLNTRDLQPSSTHSPAMAYLQRSKPCSMRWLPNPPQLMSLLNWQSQRSSSHASPALQVTLRS